jgi:hypothetical protein
MPKYRVIEKLLHQQQPRRRGRHVEYDGKPGPTSSRWTPPAQAAAQPRRAGPRGHQRAGHDAPEGGGHRRRPEAVELAQAGQRARRRRAACRASRVWWTTPIDGFAPAGNAAPLPPARAPRGSSEREGRMKHSEAAPDGAVFQGAQGRGYTDIDICNLALSHLGDVATVASIAAPSTQQEKWCARSTRSRATHCWKSTVGLRTVRARWSLPPSRRLPPGCTPTTCRRGCHQLLSVLDADGGRLHARRWSFIDGGRVRAAPIPTWREDVRTPSSSRRRGTGTKAEHLHQPRQRGAALHHQVTDTTKYPPSFVEALSYRLAAYLAGPLLKGDVGTKVASRWSDGRAKAARSRRVRRQPAQDQARSPPARRGWPTADAFRPRFHPLLRLGRDHARAVRPHRPAKAAGGAGACRNFITLPHGPAINRPGTEFVREVKTSANATRIIPFSYNNVQTFCIELGAGYFRWHTGSGHAHLRRRRGLQRRDDVRARRHRQERRHQLLQPRGRQPGARAAERDVVVRDAHGAEHLRDPEPVRGGRPVRHPLRAVGRRAHAGAPELRAAGAAPLRRDELADEQPDVHAAHERPDAFAWTVKPCRPGGVQHQLRLLRQVTTIAANTLEESVASATQGPTGGT